MTELTVTPAVTKLKDSLVNSVVDQQLCDHSGQEGSGDAQAEATPGPVKGPPQPQGQSGQSQGELDVVVKV